METLSASATRLARARSQLLLGRRARRSPLEVATHVVAINAQRRGIVELAVHARAAGVREADVERARVDERSLVRAWFMRYTLHTVPAEDAGWLLGLLGPVLIASGARRRAQLGLDDDLSDRAVAVIECELAANGPRTRAELGEAIVRAGLPVDVSGQALVHLIALASLRGEVCSGPYRAGKETHALVRDWADVGGPREREAALAELARRYLAAFAPATPADLARWSGLPMRDAREAFAFVAPELEEVRAGGEPAWLPRRNARRLLDGLEAEPATPSVRLLPPFDEHLLGWRSREPVVEQRHERLLTPGGGVFDPVVLADGRAVATWRLAPRGDTVGIRPFEPLPDAVEAALADEVWELGRFLGRDVRVG